MRNYRYLIILVLINLLYMGFLDQLIQGVKNAAGVAGNVYRVGIRGDQQVGQNGNQSLFKSKDGTYATNDWGTIEPINPLGSSQTQKPMVAQVQASEPRRLDVERYQGKSTTPIPQFSQEIQDLIWKHMGPSNDATPSAVALAGENAGADLNAINQNNDGSQDYGLAQNNTNTFEDLMKRAIYAKQLKEYGINNIADTLGNADKSIKLMQVARQYENAPRFTGDTQGASNPWERWYGWQNKGYAIDPNKTVEELAKNPAYFKLQEFLARQ